MMILERQLTECFYKVQPHIDAIAASLKAYDIDTSQIHFYKQGVEMHVFNDISATENEIMTITYTPPVEQRVELNKGRVAK